MTCVQKFISNNFGHLQKVCAGVIGEDLGDDLLQDICVTILEDNGQKYRDLCAKKELMYYLLGVIRINAFSKNTRFYYKYKKHREKETHAEINWNDIREEVTDNSYNEILRLKLAHAETMLDGLTWFEKEVFKIYYLHSHSLKTLSDATGISKTTINQTLGRARHKIKRNKTQSQENAQVCDEQKV